MVHLRVSGPELPETRGRDPVPSPGGVDMVSRVWGQRELPGEGPPRAAAPQTVTTSSPGAQSRDAAWAPSAMASVGALPQLGSECPVSAPGGALSQFTRMKLDLQ